MNQSLIVTQLCEWVVDSHKSEVLLVTLSHPLSFYLTGNFPTNSVGGIRRAMAQSSTCMGHKEREARTNKISKLATRPNETPDENCRVLIKKGPVSVETSLKELEDKYEGRAD